MKFHLLLFASFLASSLQNEITPIWKNNLLTTIPEWGREYRVSFEVKPISKKPLWSNIIHFTTDKDCCDEGNRIPGVWFYPNTLRLMISSAVNGVGNSHQTQPKPLPMDKFTSVVVEQVLNNKGQFVYSTKVDGKTVYSVVNTKPKVFKNVKVFAGSPYYSAADAVVRNLKFTVEPEFTGNVKKGRLLHTLKTWGKAWRLQFKMKPLTKIKGWTSVIHLTIGEDSKKPGDRIPGIWLYPNSMRLTVYSTINDKFVSYTTPKDLPKTKYTHIKIEQLKGVDGKYHYKIILDGEVVYTALQPKPRDFQQVKVYASDPWYPHANVYVRDFHLESVSGQHFFTTM